MMNCKPGDLAVVVKAVINPQMMGRFVIVLREAFPDEYTNKVGYPGITWIIKSASDDLLPATYPGGETLMLSEVPYKDMALRPLRDPGDDAKDEMLRPLPNKETA